MKAKYDRRKFLKQSLLLGGFVHLVGLRFSEELSSKPKPVKPNETLPEFLSEKDPTAIALGFRQNSDEVDIERFPQKANPGSVKQTCASCAQFRAFDSSSGTCLVLTGGLVKGTGWCAAWTKRS